jgi:two-component system, chemotaxis family, chemotaxis protein CheY
MTRANAMTKKATICVIDDDAAVRRTLCTHLEKAGFRTLEAANGTDGIKTVRESSPAVAVVDIIMPDQEGLSTIKELKLKSPSTRILAVSGGGLGDANRYLHFASQLGADDTLAKPFRQKEFLERIERLLAGP